MAACTPEPHNAAVSADATSSTASKPVGLEAWRAIQRQGEAAARTADPEERIAACRAYLERHPDHPQSLEVIAALLDTLVLTGNLDPEELSRLVTRRAALDTENPALPAELVRTYHKHGLPLDSGLATLDLGLRRIDLQREDASYRRSDLQAEVADLTLEQQQAEAQSMKAWLFLQHGKPRETLDVLDGMAAEREVLGPAQGSAAGPRFRSEAEEARRVLRAAALQQLGRNGEARDVLESTAGFLEDPEIARLYADLRAEFGLRSAGLVVKAPPLPAQDFALQDLDGETVRLSDHRGEIVLVTFWATWCGYCPGEMAELQAFQQQQRVTVLTVSIDAFRDRPKIEPFLERFNLDLPVLLEEPEQLTGYNYTAVPALYVIDREGRLAHARVGYDPALKDRLANEIREIVAGDRESGRSLLTLHRAPAGYGVRWQQPLGDQVDSLAVAPPIGDQPGEIAAGTRQGLSRWSAAGVKLGEMPAAGWLGQLYAADLDGDGAREWVGGGGNVKLLDSEGAVYWNRLEGDFAQLIGIRDLNGDGFQEILVHDSVRVTALQADGVPLWLTPPFRELAGAVMGPAGDVIVQADDRLFSLDERGGRGEIENAAAAKGRLLAARVATPDGELNLFAGARERFFGGPAQRYPLVDADVDGDGRDDVIVAARHGVIVYDTAGAMLLHLRGHDVSIEAIAAGNLDGQGGDEIVLFIGQYGLVVLGPTPSAHVVAGETPARHRPGVLEYP